MVEYFRQSFFSTSFVDFLSKRGKLLATPCTTKKNILPPYMYCIHVLGKAFNQSTENILHASNDIFFCFNVTLFIHKK